MKIYQQFVISVVLTLAVVAAIANIYTSEKPQLHNGDLVFQTGHDLESLAVITATDSKFTRIGIIKKTDDGDQVISLNDHYQQIPFDQFTRHGIFSRYAIYRYRQLDPDRAAKITMVAANMQNNLLPFFNFQGAKLYPSEAAYLAYRESGLDIGSVQKIRDLNMGNLMFKNIINANWQTYPVCQGTPTVDKAQNADDCRMIIEGQDVVTPVSLARDVNFELVYSNYPF